MSLCSWLYTPKCANKVGLSPQSLRGPRGGMIFFRKDPVLGVDLESAINNAVFPGLQVSILTWLGSKMKIFVHLVKCSGCYCRVVLITTLLGDLQFA